MVWMSVPYVSLLCFLLALLRTTIAAAAAQAQQRLPFAVRLPQLDNAPSGGANRTQLSVESQPRALATTLEQLIRLHEHTSEDSCYRRDETTFRFYCPSARTNMDGSLRYICITKEQLCNNEPDCPAGEDEDRSLCMFYETLHYELHQVRRMIANNFEKVASQMMHMSTDESEDA